MNIRNKDIAASRAHRAAASLALPAVTGSAALTMRIVFLEGKGDGQTDGGVLRRRKVREGVERRQRLRSRSERRVRSGSCL